MLQHPPPPPPPKKNPNTQALKPQVILYTAISQSLSLSLSAAYTKLNRYNPQLSYCRSKLANVMFARELAKRVKGSGVTVCSLHPGTVYTEITRYFLSGWLVIFKVCYYMYYNIVQQYVIIL